jgi:hypothetical protein
VAAAAAATVAEEEVATEVGEADMAVEAVEVMDGPVAISTETVDQSPLKKAKKSTLQLIQ